VATPVWAKGRRRGFRRSQPAGVVGFAGLAGGVVGLRQVVERADPVLRRLGGDGLGGGGELIVEALHGGDATALGGRFAGADLGLQDQALQVGQAVVAGGAVGQRRAVLASLAGEPGVGRGVVAGGADRHLERAAVGRRQDIGHAVVQGDRLRALGVGDALLDRRAQDLRAGGAEDVGLVVRARRHAVEARPLLRGAGVGLGEARDLVVVVVLELGGAPDQALALGDDLALQHLLLGVAMAADAVHRVVDMGVEARAEGGALAVVARPVERLAAQVLQALGHRRRAVDRVAALLAVVGVGRVEQRVLLAGDEAVDQAFDAMVVDRWRRR
jgi:hypothetical protein